MIKPSFTVNLQKIITHFIRSILQNRHQNMTLIQRNLFFIFFTVISTGFMACNDEIYSSNPQNRLTLSTDTLTFDTVFSTIGSSTSKIMIYNRNNVNLKISQIGIAGGKDSPFKINVDGSLDADNQFKDIEIRAKDSLYIFVSVTVNPTNSNSPLFIRDSLTFQTNGVKQQIQLQAFGQDVRIFRNKYILNDTTLTSEKPYLVYGYLAIDTAKTLSIKPGCKFYFHNNANLIVYGNIKAEGTADNPITLRGDRLDNIKFATPFPYNNVAGQWGGIYLLWKGGNHTLKHVYMNSGYIGVYMLNKDATTLPSLNISNCKIHNFLLYGLFVRNGNVQVSNTEISNTGSYSVYLNGGQHSFIQSTIANYFDNSNVQPVSRDRNPAVMITDSNRVATTTSVFHNCIISGSEDNEFSLMIQNPNQYSGIFDHCYIRRSEALPSSQFSAIRWSQPNDTVFKSTRYDYIKNIYFDFTLYVSSPARGLADPVVAAQYPIDLNGKSRLTDNAPDAGAYEW